MIIYIYIYIIIYLVKLNEDMSIGFYGDTFW